MSTITRSLFHCLPSLALPMITFTLLRWNSVHSKGLLLPMTYFPILYYSIVFYSYYMVELFISTILLSTVWWVPIYIYFFFYYLFVVFFFWKSHIFSFCSVLKDFNIFCGFCWSLFPFCFCFRLSLQYLYIIFHTFYV